MISSKAKKLILRAYSTGRDFASFDQTVERELISHGYATFSTAPLMKLSYDGKAYARKEVAKHG